PTTKVKRLPSAFFTVSLFAAVSTLRTSPANCSPAWTADAVTQQKSSAMTRRSGMARILAGASVACNGQVDAAILRVADLVASGADRPILPVADHHEWFLHAQVG